MNTVEAFGVGEILTARTEPTGGDRFEIYPHSPTDEAGRFASFLNLHNLPVKGEPGPVRAGVGSSSERERDEEDSPGPESAEPTGAGGLFLSPPSALEFCAGKIACQMENREAIAALPDEQTAFPNRPAADLAAALPSEDEKEGTGLKSVPIQARIVRGEPADKGDRLSIESGVTGSPVGSDEAGGTMPAGPVSGIRREGKEEKPDRPFGEPDRGARSKEIGETEISKGVHLEGAQDSSSFDFLYGVEGPPEPPSEFPAGDLSRRRFPVDENRLLRQVIERLSAFNPREGQVIRLHLQPETLGPLQMELRLSDNGVQADIVTGHLLVKELLDGNQRLLREALAEYGLRVDRFSVSIGDPGGHNPEAWKDPRDAEWVRSLKERGYIPYDSSRTETPLKQIPGRSGREAGRIDCYV